MIMRRWNWTAIFGYINKMKGVLIMNINDAIKVLGLSGKIEPNTTKKAYLSLVKQHHPDINPAGAELIKMINAAYEVLRGYEGDSAVCNDGGVDDNYPAELNVALGAICGLDGLKVEVCGSWLWVTGNTKAHKAVLKEACFKYSGKKKAWFFKPAGKFMSSKGRYSLDDIRQRHGSSKPEYYQSRRIAA